MGFSEKAKAYFHDELGLSSKEISKIMDNYSESLISRYLNSNKISNTFINKIKKYFPDADVAYLINNDADDNKKVNEITLAKRNRSKQLVEEIELRLKELKGIVSLI